MTKTLQVKGFERLSFWIGLVRSSFAIVRGFIGGAALLLGGVLVTLMLALAFQYVAEVRNDRAGAAESRDWGTPASPESPVR